jgi:hypothetical protein
VRLNRSESGETLASIPNPHGSRRQCFLPKDTQCSSEAKKLYVSRDIECHGLISAEKLADLQSALLILEVLAKMMKQSHKAPHSGLGC